MKSYARFLLDFVCPLAFVLALAFAPLRSDGKVENTRRQPTPARAGNSIDRPPAY